MRNVCRTSDSLMRRARVAGTRGRGCKGQLAAPGQLRSTEQIYSGLWLGCHALGAGIKHRRERSLVPFFF